MSELAIVAWSEGTHPGDSALDLGLVSELAASARSVLPYCSWCQTTCDLPG